MASVPNWGGRRTDIALLIEGALECSLVLLRFGLTDRPTYSDALHARAELEFAPADEFRRLLVFDLFHGRWSSGLSGLASVLRRCLKQHCDNSIDHV
jgi:hypothetical protein